MFAKKDGFCVITPCLGILNESSITTAADDVRFGLFRNAN